MVPLALYSLPYVQQARPLRLVPAVAQHAVQAAINPTVVAVHAMFAHSVPSAQRVLLLLYFVLPAFTRTMDCSALHAHQVAISRIAAALSAFLVQLVVNAQQLQARALAFLQSHGVDLEAMRQHLLPTAQHVRLVHSSRMQHRRSVCRARQVMTALQTEAHPILYALQDPFQMETAHIVLHVQQVPISLQPALIRVLRARLGMLVLKEQLVILCV